MSAFPNGPSCSILEVRWPRSLQTREFPENQLQAVIVLPVMWWMSPRWTTEAESLLFHNQGVLRGGKLVVGDIYPVTGERVINHFHWALLGIPPLLGYSRDIPDHRGHQAPVGKVVPCKTAFRSTSPSCVWSSIRTRVAWVSSLWKCDSGSC